MAGPGGRTPADRVTPIVDPRVRWYALVGAIERLWRARLIRGSVRECDYPTILAEQARFAHICREGSRKTSGKEVECCLTIQLLSFWLLRRRDAFSAAAPESAGHLCGRLAPRPVRRDTYGWPEGWDIGRWRDTYGCRALFADAGRDTYGCRALCG
jgi:hypothetical protein